MRSYTFIMAAFASAAISQPFGHHNHRRIHQQVQHEKRDVVTEWVTETTWQTVTELIDSTTTEWITPGATTTLSTSTILASSPPSSTGVPGQFFEGSTSTNVLIPSSTPTTSVYVPTSTSSPAAVQPETETPTYVPPVQSTSVAPIATEQVQPPTTTNTAAPVVVQTTSSSTSSSPTTSASSGGSSGTKYTGDLTYYALGLGSCGSDDTGKDETENIVALAAGMMGAQSNGNPWCGTSITVSRNGKTAIATIKDKCPGCEGNSIDGSEALFKALFDDSLDDGRGEVTWWVNE